MSVGEYLRRLNAIPLPMNVPSEEVAPDFIVGVKPHDATQLAVMQIPEIATPEVKFRFFVDGVQRTVPICQVPVGSFRVPIFIAHLIAGAMERVHDRLNPFLKREAIVLYIPLEGLRSIDSSLSPPTTLAKFGHGGNIYNLIMRLRQPRRIDFWTDISVRLSEAPGDEVNLGPVELSAVGAVRRAARNRSQVLLRIMELGVVWEIISRSIFNEDEFVVLDGPVFLPFKYAGLTSQQLATVMSSSGEQIGDPRQAYHLLSHLIGAVKQVEIIPAQGLAVALSLEPDLRVPVYLFSEMIRGVTGDLVSRHVVSCFVWLRRELNEEIPLIWSPTSGLARIDVPFPAIVDSRINWYSHDFHLDLSDGSRSRRRLEAILRTVVAERWPIPEESPPRMLTELYAIAETERWLKGHLLPEQELRGLAEA